MRATVKLNHVAIEVSVEELESSAALRRFMAALVAGTPANFESEDNSETEEDGLPTGLGVNISDVPGVDPAGQGVVKEQLATNPAAEYFLRFLAEASGWPDVVVHGVKPKGRQAGAPLDYTRYLRLRRAGSQLGGFAYVYAADGRVNFRLAFESTDELQSTAPDAWQPTTGHRAYRVSIRISNQSTLDQALKLAREAYART